MKRSRLTAIVMLLLTGCGDSRPDQWDAFVYPNHANLAVHEEIRGFKTFELCQQAAIDRMRAIQTEGGGDYECGHKCEHMPGLSGNVCAETKK